MGEEEKGVEPVFTAVNDIRVYADGIDVALRESKFKEAADYLQNIRQRVDTIAAYLESKRS